MVSAEDLAVVSVLSGNRNFEGRINPDVRMNYLASPPLCVAYAIAGTMDIDLYDEPLGEDDHGESVFLKDIWPSGAEVARTVEEAVQSDMFRKSYGEVFEGDERWHSLENTGTAGEAGGQERFDWDPDSTYVRQPPFFEDLPREPEALNDIEDARVLAVLGDSVTTDHISPAGSIKRDSPAGQYLIEHGVQPKEFNSYGSRRGNHEVMMRGTFANIRLRNQLAPGTEGGVTLYLGDQDEGEQMSIYDAAMRYQEQGTPLIVLAGKEYGSGSSRDWAAKGTRLLGARAVIAESFERIHRSNLVGMGVLPLQFQDGESALLSGTHRAREVHHPRVAKRWTPSLASSPWRPTTRNSRSGCGSTRRRSSAISTTEASCSSCSGSCWPADRWRLLVRRRLRLCLGWEPGGVIGGCGCLPALGSLACLPVGRA